MFEIGTILKIKKDYFSFKMEDDFVLIGISTHNGRTRYNICPVNNRWNNAYLSLRKYYELFEKYDETPGEWEDITDELKL